MAAVREAVRRGLPKKLSPPGECYQYGGTTYCLPSRSLDETLPAGVGPDVDYLRSAGSLKGGELSDGTDCDSSDCESRASPLKSDLTARHGRELDVVTKSLGVGPGVTDNAVDNRSSPAPRWARMMKALAHTILCLPREEQLATLTYGPSLGLL